MELLCLFNWYLCDSYGRSKGDFILRNFRSCYLNWGYWWHLSLHLLTLWPILLISRSFLSSNFVKFALLILHIPKNSICLCRSLYFLLLWGNLFVFFILRLWCRWLHTIVQTDRFELLWTHIIFSCIQILTEDILHRLFSHVRLCRLIHELLDILVILNKVALTCKIVARIKSNSLMWRQKGDLLLRNSASRFEFSLVQLSAFKVCLANIQNDGQSIFFHVFIEGICVSSLVLFDSSTLDIYIYVYHWKHASGVVIVLKLLSNIHTFLLVMQICWLLHFIILLRVMYLVCFPFRAFHNIFFLLNVLYHHLFGNGCV